MSTIAFSFNGVDLTPYLKYIKTTETLGNKRTVSSATTAGIGEALTSVDIGPKILKVKVSLASRPIGAQGFVDPAEAPVEHKATLQELKEVVSGILHATTPQPLHLPDKPGRFYQALPQGDIELSGITDWYDQATIEFYIPDGVALDVTETVHEVRFSDRTKMQASITYEGTAPAYPVIEYTQETENAYLGVTNGKQSWVLGDVTESDTGSYKEDDWLLNAQPWKNILTGAAGPRGIVKPNTYGNPQTYSIEREDGRDMQWTGKQDATGIAGWEYQLPADSQGDSSGALNMYCYWRQWFETASMSQKSWIEVTFRDRDNNIVFGVRTMKSRLDNTAVFQAFVASSDGLRFVLDKQFQANNNPNQNPFTHTNGHMDIRRSRDRIRFFYGGVYHDFTEGYIADKKITKVSLYVRNLDGAPHVTRCYFGNLLVQKLAVNKTFDAVNRYSPGATVVSDGVERIYTLNNQPKLGDVAVGSEFVELSPGANTITFQNSSWSKSAGKAKIRYRARYL